MTTNFYCKHRNNYTDEYFCVLLCKYIKKYSLHGRQNFHFTLRADSFASITDIINLM